jgi:hypothetical protein
MTYATNDMFFDVADPSEAYDKGLAHTNALFLANCRHES